MKVNVGDDEEVDEVDLDDLIFQVRCIADGLDSSTKLLPRFVLALAIIVKHLSGRSATLPWGTAKEIACDQLLSHLGMLNLSFSVTDQQVAEERAREMVLLGLTEEDLNSHIQRFERRPPAPTPGKEE